MLELDRNLKSQNVKVFPSSDKIRAELKKRSDHIDQNIFTGEMNLVINARTLEEKLVPYVYIVNLKSHLEYVVNNLIVTGKFVTDEHFHDEIWVMIGADKGGGSSKLVLSVLNSTLVNSTDHTELISYFEAVDTYSNMKIIFGKIFDQLPQIRYVECSRGTLAIRFFLIGFSVLEQLRKRDGKPHTPDHIVVQCRTVADYNVNAEKQQPGQNTKSICNEMLVRIDDLDHLVPPPLHISLGLGLLFFEMLEQKCQEVDNEGLKDRDIDLYRNWKEKSLDVCAVQEELNQNISNAKQNDFVECIDCDSPYHKQCIFGPTANFKCMECCTGKTMSADSIVKLKIQAISEKKSELADLKSRLSEAQNQLQEIFKVVNSSMGPVTKRLNEILAEIGIDRQAYYGGCIVGNHINKMLKNDDKSNNPQKLCSVLSGHADDDYTKFLELFERLSNLYALYTACRFLTADEKSLFRKLCHDFGRFYTDAFPSFTITPKLHILIYHAPDFVDMWGSLGLFGEQGLEGKHASVNRDNRIYCTVRDQVLRTKYLFINQGLYATKPPKSEERNENASVVAFTSVKITLDSVKSVKGLFECR
ncbi:uncharacterized protein LOC141911568 [Tubulanus polymorphus]|uniref:uncharacterized protein LOC141911568 n=1 Tax=Tubulanus polymorphus TaxID=672921 RepID=UPI003DA6B79B